MEINPISHPTFLRTSLLPPKYVTRQLEDSQRIQRTDQSSDIDDIVGLDR